MRAGQAWGGTLARPASSLWHGGGWLAREPRLLAAVAAALVLHLALLVLRPGVSGARQPAVAAPTLAIRMLRAAPPAVDIAVPTSVSDAAPPSKPDEASEKRRIATPEVAVAEAAGAKKSSPASGAASLQDARSDTQPAAPPVPTADSRLAAEPSLAAAPEYVFGMRLDPGPRPLDDIEPDYPDPIRLREGTVILRVLISETGHVDDVAVVRATPKGVFEQAAVEAFAKARFAPGLLAGTPVKSQITVEVNFMPINRGATITGRTY